MIELLRTKLFIPRPRKNLVSRPRLVEGLNAGLDKKLTLIAAPAGFGKTTLLSEWIPQSPRCVTWFSLDEADNDSTRFWTYFISSLQGLRSDLGDGALTLLQSPQAPPITSSLTALINDITAFPDAFAMVLDDYHAIESQPIHEALTYLIAHLPERMHLVITTRVDPPLPLARFRVHDQLIEVRANHLRFTTEEVAAFLTQTMELNLTNEEVSALETRTEGWVAGLQIAALSMQGRDDIPGFIKTFSGSHRHILGYLAEEVINQQPESTLNFLLQTSILDRLCGPLCDAVTRETNGQAILESLEHANLFIIPLDDEGRWYRYHHLFAEMMQARLQQNQPEITAELHRRASEWYERNDFLVDTLSHANKAGEIERAATLIERAAPAWLESGAVTTLRGWLDTLPERIVRSRPQLNLIYAYVLAYTGDPAGFKTRLSEIELMLRASNTIPAVERNDLLGEVAALQARVSFDRNQRPDVDELRGILATISADNTRVQGLLAFAIGYEERLSGNMVEATKFFTQAAIRAHERGDKSQWANSMGFVADLQEIQGLLRKSAQTWEDTLQMTTLEKEQLTPFVATAYISLGKLDFEWNDLEKAERYLRQGMELGRLSGVEAVEFQGATTLAFVLQGQGDASGADAMIQHANQIAKKWNLQSTTNRIVAYEARLLLMRGQWQAATRLPLFNSITDSEDLDESLGIEYFTIARLMIAQDQLVEALQLLNRLLSAAKHAGRIRHMIETLTLQALAWQTKGNTPEAILTLAHTLNLAEPEGYIRTFVDEGEPMRQLLLDYQSTIKKRIGDSVDSDSLRLLAYTDKLLTAFSQPAAIKKPESESLLEPLSERELDILRLIATGRSNQEIADILVIAMSTVKSHINSIYGKLGTNRRTQAVALAHDMGLLSE